MFCIFALGIIVIPIMDGTCRPYELLPSEQAMWTFRGAFPKAYRFIMELAIRMTSPGPLQPLVPPYSPGQRFISPLSVLLARVVTEVGDVSPSGCGAYSYG